MASALEGGSSDLEAEESQNYPVTISKQCHAVCARFLGYSEFRHRSAGQDTVLPGNEFGERQALFVRANKLVVDSQISNS